MNKHLWGFLEDVAAAISNGEKLELIVDADDVVVDPEVAERFYKEVGFKQALVTVTPDMLRKSLKKYQDLYGS